MVGSFTLLTRWRTASCLLVEVWREHLPSHVTREWSRAIINAGNAKTHRTLVACL